jgi:hypothetical protein
VPEDVRNKGRTAPCGEVFAEHGEQRTMSVVAAEPPPTRTLPTTRFARGGRGTISVSRSTKRWESPPPTKWRGGYGWGAEPPRRRRSLASACGVTLLALDDRRGIITTAPHPYPPRRSFVAGGGGRKRWRAFRGTKRLVHRSQRSPTSPALI